MGFIATILVGILAGWLAEKIMKTDVSIWMNLVYGLIGSALGSLVLGLVGMDSPTGIIWGVIVAAAGACLAMFIVKKVKERAK